MKAFFKFVQYSLSIHLIIILIICPNLNSNAQVNNPQQFSNHDLQISVNSEIEKIKFIVNLLERSAAENVGNKLVLSDISERLILFSKYLQGLEKLNTISYWESLTSWGYWLLGYEFDNQKRISQEEKDNFLHIFEDFINRNPVQAIGLNASSLLTLSKQLIENENPEKCFQDTFFIKSEFDPKLHFKVLMFLKNKQNYSVPSRRSFYLQFNQDKIGSGAEKNIFEIFHYPKWEKLALGKLKIGYKFPEGELSINKFLCSHYPLGAKGICFAKDLLPGSGIVMPLYSKTLDEILPFVRENLNPFQVILKIAKGVQNLHQIGLCHYDLKDKNILVSYPYRNLDGASKNSTLSADDRTFNFQFDICDFGLSIFPKKLIENDEVRPFRGTPLYMAPEIFSFQANWGNEKIQLKDKIENALKVDVFSLGLLSYDLLTGVDIYKFYVKSFKEFNVNLNKENAHDQAISRLIYDRKDELKEKLSHLPNEKIYHPFRIFFKHVFEINPEKRLNINQFIDGMTYLSSLKSKGEEVSFDIFSKENQKILTGNNLKDLQEFSAYLKSVDMSVFEQESEKQNYQMLKINWKNKNYFVLTWSSKINKNELDYTILPYLDDEFSKEKINEVIKFFKLLGIFI